MMLTFEHLVIQNDVDNNPSPFLTFSLKLVVLLPKIIGERISLTTDGRLEFHTD